MSSPLAKLSKGIVGRFLVRIHQGASHSRRIDVLSDHLGQLIAKLTKPVRTGLDIGCGDMGLTRSLETRIPGSIWSGVDLYALPGTYRNDPNWIRYCQFDGKRLPFADDQFDVALFCDVLHHADECMCGTLIADALRVAGTVVVKDHFEYGICSRLMLRAMDFVGNYGYGVSVPSRYFTPERFRRLVADAGGTVSGMRTGMQLYGQLGPLRHLLRPEWHFLAVIERN
jgi:hypothetical protein